MTGAETSTFVPFLRAKKGNVPTLEPGFLVKFLMVGKAIENKYPHIPGVPPPPLGLNSDRCIRRWRKVEVSFANRSCLSLNGPFVWCLVFQFCSRKAIKCFSLFQTKVNSNFFQSWLTAGSSNNLRLTVVCK